MFHRFRWTLSRFRWSLVLRTGRLCQFDAVNRSLHRSSTTGAFSAKTFEKELNRPPLWFTFGPGSSLIFIYRFRKLNDTHGHPLAATSFFRAAGAATLKKACVRRFRVPIGGDICSSSCPKQTLSQPWRLAPRRNSLR